MIRLGCGRAVLENARTCITGMNVPKTALKKFCNIAKIKIKTYQYIKVKAQAKKLQCEKHWDETNSDLKDPEKMNKLTKVSVHAFLHFLDL